MYQTNKHWNGTQMVSLAKPRRDIVLFNAGPSLLEQIADWAANHPEIALHVAEPRRPRTICSLLDRAAVSVIDATESPGLAMAIVDCAAAAECAKKAAVYTEQMHAGLEIFTRVRGMLLLLGPMPTLEWQGFFAGQFRAAARAYARAPMTSLLETDTKSVIPLPSKVGEEVKE